MAAWDKDLEPAKAPAWEKDLLPVASVTPAAPKRGLFGGNASDAKRAAMSDTEKMAASRAELGGLLRGGRDIIDTGAELIAKGIDKVTGDGKPTMAGLVTGQPQGLYATTKAGNDAAKAEFKMAATPEAEALRTLGNVVSTAPVGGVLANTLKHVPRLATAAPGFINAVRSSGMTTGTAPLAAGAGRTASILAGAKDVALRSAGGAVTGGAAAGLVDPEQAATGAVVGGALPVALRAAGAAGGAAGKVLRGPEQAPDLARAVSNARAAGLVIPPSQARPTLLNRLMEGFAGKLTTAQNASARNAESVSRIVADDLGLPAGAKITPDALAGLRKQAGMAYEAVGSTGTIQPGPAYEAALDKIVSKPKLAALGFPGAAPNPIIDMIDGLRSKQFDAASAVAKISQLRKQADTAYAGGNKELGSALKSGAAALEDAIDTHLQSLGVPPEMLQGFRDARTQIAKTYSVQKALNAETGTIDARKLAAELQRGKPLSGGLRTVGEFAARFPKAAQTPEAMGSLPGTSPLDWHAAGATSLATGNPLAMAGVALRPTARSLVLSDLVQNRLVQPPAQNFFPLSSLANSADLAQLGYRAAPVAVGGR